MMEDFLSVRSQFLNSISDFFEYLVEIPSAVHIWWLLCSHPGVEFSGADLISFARTHHISLKYLVYSLSTIDEDDSIKCKPKSISLSQHPLRTLGLHEGISYWGIVQRHNPEATATYYEIWSKLCFLDSNLSQFEHRDLEQLKSYARHIGFDSDLIDMAESKEGLIAGLGRSEREADVIFTFELPKFDDEWGILKHH